MQVGIDLHNEFHFAENTDSKGCCCCWKSTTVRPREYFIDADNRLIARTRSNYRDRILANKRLEIILKHKFDDFSIDNERAFELLKKRVNDPMNNGDPITSERLSRIVSAIFEIKKEIE